ncbi:MAG: hypothetical protein ABI668_12620 [Sphingorhabdus sp.]
MPLLHLYGSALYATLEKRAIAAGYSLVFEKPLRSERLIAALATFAAG